MAFLCARIDASAAASILLSRYLTYKTMLMRIKGNSTTNGITKPIRPPTMRCAKSDKPSLVMYLAAPPGAEERTE